VISLHNGKNNFESDVIKQIELDDYELLGMPEKFRWAVLKMICKKQMSVLSSLKSSKSTFKSEKKPEPQKRETTVLTGGAKNTSFTSDESDNEKSKSFKPLPINPVEKSESVKPDEGDANIKKDDEKSSG
jgi:hypothetical protein